ncbi:MAG: hypothetical protein EH225_02690, partial [Calditrichaeota bacterium]
MGNQDQKQFLKKVDRANKIARMLITIGGYGVVISIAAILLFLVYQSVPLFFHSSVEQQDSIPVKDVPGKILLTGIDQYQELIYLLDDVGIIRFMNRSGEVIRRDTIPLRENEKLSVASKGSLQKPLFATGTSSGRIITAEIQLQPVYEGNKRFVVPAFRIINSLQAETESDSMPAHIERLVYRETEDAVELWSWVNHSGDLKTIIYDPDEDEYFRHDLTEKIGAEKISTLTATFHEEDLVAGTLTGELFWFDLSDPENVFLKDNWKVTQASVSALQFLIGDNALVIGDTDGAVQVWFPVRQEKNQFRFMPVHQFLSHNAAVVQLYPSPRNRSFLSVDAAGSVHMKYSTTAQTEVTFRKSEYAIQTASFSPKSNGIVAVDSRNRLGFFLLDNEHPEVTLETLFGKVWYEGYPKPEFVWQSTGGSDEFEPKLSLIPLIFGTVKGTLYAMIFSIPLAILAAIYVSQFAPKWLARIVKPTVEIMAALPSVVIGFLAGLYFSPVVEKHLVSVFLFLILLPIFFAVGIFIWKMVPEKRRMRAPLGWEIVFILPVIAVTIIFIITIANSFETIFFDGNLRQWLYDIFGLVYDQRNSLVVGFALGFAVIPIIFTI